MNRQQQIDRFLLAAHRLAAARLRQDPAQLEQVKATLRRWRSQSGATRSDPYWDEWEQLLAAGPEAVEQATCVVGDHADALRNVSPIGVLLSANERARLLREARST